MKTKDILKWIPESVQQQALRNITRKPTGDTRVFPQHGAKLTTEQYVRVYNAKNNLK